LIAAGTLVAVGVFAMRAWPRARTVSRERVLVTQFENRTGDSTLDALGDMEADWLTRGIVASQFVDVVDPRSLFARGRTRTGEAANPQELARRTGSAYVITGSYYRSADSLLFFAGIIDANGRVVRSVGPLAYPRTRPVDGVEAMRTRLMTSLVSILDPRSRARIEIEQAPPRYEAYQPYIAGWDDFWLGKFHDAESLFVVAASRDSSFDMANVGLAITAANVLDCGVVDSISRLLTPRFPRLTELDRLGVRIAVARCHGQNEEMFRLVMLRLQLSPSQQGSISEANAAEWARRPGDALKILQHLNPDVDLDWMPRADRLDYWGGLASAYHLLGDHQAELATIDRSQLKGLAMILCRGPALAALHQSAATLAEVDSAFTMSDRGLSSGMLPNTDGRAEYASSPAWVVLWIAHELTVHGDSVSGGTAARRAVTWIDGLPRADRDAWEMRVFKVEFLEQAGAFPLAKEIAQRLVAEDTSNVDFRGLLAGLAAETGDSALADKDDAWLASVPPARAHWGASFYRARLASLRGRPEQAISLMNETLEKGAWPTWLHLDLALHRLVARPDFIALMKPRG
jgi:TolB-like protein